MQNYTHELSKENLLGTNPSAEELKKYSPDLLTGNHTPQTLILCSDDDTLISYQQYFVLQGTSGK
ncbi:hypothetical protein [Flavobacterium sp. N2038]|uniref:hypothetical protein n=1 Tax=Flavobacterium sp. N2038 TaxID=2986829 RepID=UPI0022252EB5|nr:hypothetical protein [Flavobacterium sp. N2038]